MTSEGQVLLDDALPPGPATLPAPRPSALQCPEEAPVPTHVAEGIPYVCMASRKPTAARWLGQCPRHLLLFPTTAAAASNVDGMEEEIEKDGGRLERGGGSERGRVPQEMGGGREKRKFAVHFMISPTVVCESDTPLSLCAFSPSPRKGEAE